MSDTTNTHVLYSAKRKLVQPLSIESQLIYDKMGKELNDTIKWKKGKKVEKTQAKETCDQISKPIF